MRNVNEIVLRMREAIGAPGDKELGEHLGGVGPSTISSWKTRVSVPYPYIDQLVQETGRTFEWFLSGKELKPIISELSETYQGEKKHPADLQHIIDEWPDLCDVQKTAVISVLDAFSKQDTNSLEPKENKA